MHFSLCNLNFLHGCTIELYMPVTSIGIRPKSPIYWATTVSVLCICYNLHLTYLLTYITFTSFEDVEYAIPKGKEGIR